MLQPSSRLVDIDSVDSAAIPAFETAPLDPSEGAGEATEGAPTAFASLGALGAAASQSVAQKAAAEQAALDTDPEAKARLEAEATAKQAADLEAEFGLTDMGGFQAHSEEMARARMEGDDARALTTLNDEDVKDHVSLASTALYSTQDEAAQIDLTELPGLRPDAAYPWQAVDTLDEETGKPVRYYVHAVTKKTEWELPEKALLWQQKLDYLSHLTPRPVNQARVLRGLEDGSLTEPNRWKWRETEEERRRRLRYERELAKKEKKEEQRRREKPTDQEALEDVVELLIRGVGHAVQLWFCCCC